MTNVNMLNVTATNFESEVLNSDVPVLVDFWAPWCGPCRMVGPIMEQLADEYNGKLKVGKLNVDEQRELAAAFRVMSIPTIMLFKGGKVVESALGARPKEFFKNMVDRYLD